MFAGALNKGSGGALPVMGGLMIVGVLLSLFAVKDVETSNYPNLFYNYFAQKIDNRVLIAGLNFLFIGLGAFLVRLIAVNQEITEKQNYFPEFVYLLTCIAAVPVRQVIPQALTNVFIMYAVYKLLITYRRENVLNHIFEAAFWLSTSAFINISSIISFPLFFISLLILRSFRWREWVVAILGFIVPLFLYECIAYLSDFTQWYFIEAARDFFQTLRMPRFSEYYLPFLILSLLLLVISIIYGVISGFGNTVKKQRAKAILLWYIGLSIFGFFSEGANGTRVLLIYAFPLAFFLGDFLYSIKQLKVTNTIIILLLFCMAVIFMAQYGLI